MKHKNRSIFPVALSLGSNLGDRRKNLSSAIKLLSEGILEDIKVSSFHKTDPIDCPPNTGEFLNAAVGGKTSLAPFELLSVCQQIENLLGRPTIHGYHTDRTIDIDILFYSNLNLNTASLTLPHPEMDRRSFVLKPLAEITDESLKVAIP